MMAIFVSTTRWLGRASEPGAIPSTWSRILSNDPVTIPRLCMGAVAPVDPSTEAFVSLQGRSSMTDDTVMMRPHVRGKFLFVGDQKLYLRGVTYGTFRPGADGQPYPDRPL